MAFIRIMKKAAPWRRPDRSKFLPALLSISASLWLGWMAIHAAVANVYLNAGPGAIASTYDLRGPLAELNRRLIAEGRPATSRELGLVRQSLRINPLDAVALRILSQSSERRPQSGDRRQPDNTAGLLATAQDVSRRELYTQLLLVVESARRGDAASSIRHIDIGLTTHPEAGEALYPTLKNALPDQQVIAALAPYVRRDRPWAPGFLSYALDSGAEPALVAGLILDQGRAARSASLRGVVPLLLTKLLAHDENDLALRLSEMLPHRDPQPSQSLAFASPDSFERFGPLAWGTLEPSGAGSRVVAIAGDRYSLEAYAQPGVSAVVASRALMLVPGTYSIVASAQADRVNPGASVLLVLSCVREGASARLWSSPNLLRPNPRSSFLVPTDCRQQRAEIGATGGEGQDDLQFTLASPDLVRR